MSNNLTLHAARRSLFVLFDYMSEIILLDKLLFAISTITDSTHSKNVIEIIPLM